MFFGIFVILLLSQARGAAVLFAVCGLFFDNGALTRRARWGAGLVLLVLVGVSFALSPALWLHYRAALSLGEGASTGYRAYLLNILISEFDRYWLLGLPADEVQRLLANRFSDGPGDIHFALDNAFVHFAFKYGALALVGLIYIGARLIATGKSAAIFMVGWLLLDDILGSGFG